MDIDQLAALAFKFGPFFFAVLLVITSRWAYEIYRKATDKTAPSFSRKERNTFRNYFIGVSIFAAILIIISIAWWITHQPGLYSFKGQIIDLKDYEKITSSTLFFRAQLMEKIDPNVPLYRDEHFLIVNDKPFTVNQEFRLLYSKGEGVVEQFIIRYKPGVEPIFKIEWDKTEQRNVFRCINPPPYSFAPYGSLYAQTFDNSASAVTLKRNSLKDQHLIELLQNERSDIGAKISALDSLLIMPKDKISKYIEFETSKEPMVVTLLDLKRHTDDELAFKAEKILNDKFDLDAYLLNNLTSNDQTIHEKIEKIFFKMSQKSAEKILEKIPLQYENRTWIRNLKNDVREGKKLKLLVPTGSSKGDRYYVQAEWDPGNQKVVNCLTKLFHYALIHNRTFEEEIRLMKGRKVRWVYWYSKEWALGIAEDINNCGGKTSFVGLKNHKWISGGNE